MNKEEAIKRIKQMVEDDDELGCLFIRKDIEALNMAISALKGEWIPVSERLPEESGRYLTYIVNEYDEKLQYIMTADYIARPTPIEGLSPWNVDDECASDNVVAWMPLPEGYKEGGTS